jgi:hypothetical protein
MRSSFLDKYGFIYHLARGFEVKKGRLDVGTSVFILNIDYTFINLLFMNATVGPW